MECKFRCNLTPHTEDISTGREERGLEWTSPDLNKPLRNENDNKRRGTEAGDTVNTGHESYNCETRYITMEILERWRYYISDGDAIWRLN